MQEKQEYEQANLEFINLKMKILQFNAKKKDYLQYTIKLREKFMITKLKVAQNSSINKKL